MTQRYVLDTNVIISDPHIHTKLDGQIIIPTTVLHELDRNKNAPGEKGKNIRQFARYLISEDAEDIQYMTSDNLPGDNDSKIIAAVRAIGQESGENPILVTNDIYMSLLAKSQGVPIQRHDSISTPIEDSHYTGVVKFPKAISIDDCDIFENNPTCPNKYILAKNGLFQWQKGGGVRRLGKDRSIWGIRHKSAEQRCAIDALMDDKIQLVTISGKAGTGKTLLAIAAGLEKTISENKYQKLLVSRPVVPMGQDIGFLPGDLKEKLGPWMQPIFDNIDFLFNCKDDNSSDRWMELEHEGLLKIEALTYIRGRSIPRQYMIIDEAQNLTRHEVKTIISRAGEGTKIILTGDPDQIDNPKLDSVNNGLTYVVEKFKDQEVAAHITLTKCERSTLANIAAEIL